MKKKKYIWMIIIVLIIGGYYWHNKSKNKTATVQYKTVVAEKGTLINSISGAGNVIVDSSATVDPTITGTVSGLAVNIGDAVKKGQLLFNIINDQLAIDKLSSQNSLLQTRQSVESAKASEKQAKYDLDHNDSGLATKKILENKFNAAKLSLSYAKSNLSLAEDKYQNALSDANKRKVTAPIDGTVNAINIKNGDDLGRLSSNSNSSAPMIIGDLNTLKAQVAINEVDISNVKIGQKAMLTFSAIDGLDISGKVEKMDSLGTLSSGVVTYSVTITFDTLDPRIKPGMSVSASVITSVKQDVTIVPSGAVKTQKGSSYIQVLVNGVPQDKVVKIGEYNNTDTEILSGINIGDKVITQTINPNASSSATANSSLRLPGVGGGGAGRAFHAD